MASRVLGWTRMSWVSGTQSVRSTVSETVCVLEQMANQPVGRVGCRRQWCCDPTRRAEHMVESVEVLEG